MSRRRGSGTDPSTVAGKPENEIGGEGGGEGEADVSTFGETPLRTAYPEGWRVGSEFQGIGSVITSLPRINTERELEDLRGGYGCVIDPQNEKRLVRLGGGSFISADEPPIVLTYDTFSNSWSDDPYPDLDEIIGDVADDAEYNGMAHGAVGDYIVLAGGEIDGNAVDRIFTLDTSADTPTWEESTQTLPTPVGNFPASAVYQGEIYVIGGGIGFDDAESQVVKYDPAADDLTQLDDLNGGSLSMMDSSAVPVIDGEAYLAGTFFGTFNEEEEEESNGTSFFKYDLETEELTRLADLDVLGYEGEELGESGAGQGSLVEYEGNLVYMDGFYFFENVDVGYYSVEDDEWTGEGWESFDPNDYGRSVPFHGNNRGVEIGGVIYLPGNSNKESSFVAHIPQKDPFGE